MIPSVRDILTEPLIGPTEAERIGTWREDWMTSSWERRILVALLKAANVRHMVEIGVNEGWTAACILENVPTIQTYIGIDVTKGYVTMIPEQQSEVPDDPGCKAKHDHRFQLLVSPYGSYDVRPNHLTNSDAFFIDGDHSSLSVAYDTMLATLCINNGIIIWHDYSPHYDNDITRFLQMTNMLGRNIVHVTDTNIAYQIIK